MKIFIVLLLSFIGLHSSYAIEYRKALITDVPNLLKLYDDMTLEDKKKLVLVPPKFRQKDMYDAVLRGHVFGAFTTNNQAIAMVHLYLLDEGECVKKLNQFKYKKSIRPCLAERYEVFAGPLSQSRETFGTSKIDSCFEYSRSQVFLYLGSAYTLNSARGNRVISTLNAFAFMWLKDDILTRLKKVDTQQITLLYGQVAENLKRNFILRAFSKFLQSAGLIHANPFYLLQWAYKHRLPEFKECDNKLVQLESDIDAYGCILTSKINTSSGLPL